MDAGFTRREFLETAIGTTTVLSAAVFAQRTANRRPNILFILADDLGYGDLSCHGEMMKSMDAGSGAC